MSQDSERWSPHLPPADPRQIPEHTLWTLAKDARRAEARVRQVYGGRWELRFYVSGSSGALDLVWSQVMAGGLELGALADQKLAEFQAKGWVEDPASLARRVFGDHDEPLPWMKTVN